MTQVNNFLSRKPGVSFIVLATILTSLMFTAYNRETKPADVQTYIAGEFDTLHQDLAKYLGRVDGVSLILERTGYGIVYSGPDHRIIQWNKRAAEIFGYNLTDAYSMPLTIEDLMTEEVRAKHYRSYEWGMQTPDGHVHSINCQVARRKDGTPVSINLTLVVPPMGKEAIALIREIPQTETKG